MTEYDDNIVPDTEEDEDFEYGDYDLFKDPSEVAIVEPQDALPYHDVDEQDGEGGFEAPESQARGFTSVVGRTPEQAVDMANNWRIRKLFFGVGQCLRTIRQTYNVPSKYGTATLSWEAADHKHFASRGTDVPRGAPVWWTGGSSGAGHIAISCGGGVCISTDWAEPGRLAYARIDDITSLWNLNFKGYTREVNDIVVWRPTPPTLTVSLKNLKPGKRNNDVVQLKRKLKAKGYTGFLVNSNKYGSGIKKAYAKYQRRLGYNGAAADGIPGRTSLRKLGFKVKA